MHYIIITILNISITVEKLSNKIKKNTSCILETNCKNNDVSVKLWKGYAM